MVPARGAATCGTGSSDRALSCFKYAARSPSPFRGHVEGEVVQADGLLHQAVGCGRGVHVRWYFDQLEARRRARKPRAARRAAAEAARLLHPEERVEFHGALDVPAFDGSVVEGRQCTCMHNKQGCQCAPMACVCHRSQIVVAARSD